MENSNGSPGRHVMFSYKKIGKTQTTMWGGFRLERSWAGLHSSEHKLPLQGSAGDSSPWQVPPVMGRMRWDVHVPAAPTVRREVLLGSHPWG